MLGIATRKPQSSGPHAAGAHALARWQACVPATSSAAMMGMIAAIGKCINFGPLFFLLLLLLTVIILDRACSCGRTGRRVERKWLSGRCWTGPAPVDSACPAALLREACVPRSRRMEARTDDENDNDAVQL